jgi:hypothetical protein
VSVVGSTNSSRVDLGEVIFLTLLVNIFMTAIIEKAFLKIAFCFIACLNFYVGYYDWISLKPLKNKRSLLILVHY